MKNLLSLSILLLIAVNIYAQDTDFNKTVVRGSKEKYNVIGPNLKEKIVTNSNNSLRNDKIMDTRDPFPTVHPKLADYHYDKNVITQIFYDTFPQDRLKKLADKESNSNLFVNFYVNPNGKILEVSFSFSDNLSLKPVEIEKLETRLKKEFKYTLNYEAFKKYKYYPLYVIVNFKRLLNHDPNSVF